MRKNKLAILVIFLLSAPLHYSNAAEQDARGKNGQNYKEVNGDVYNGLTRVATIRTTNINNKIKIIPTKNISKNITTKIKNLIIPKKIGFSEILYNKKTNNFYIKNHKYNTTTRLLVNKTYNSLKNGDNNIINIERTVGNGNIKIGNNNSITGGIRKENIYTNSNNVIRSNSGNITIVNKGDDKFKLKKEIYRLELNGLILDPRVSKKFDDYMDRLLMESAWPESIDDTWPPLKDKSNKIKPKKEVENIAKCEKSLRIEMGRYTGVYNYEFKKINFKDKAYKSVINSCLDAYKSSGSVEFLYLVAIGYHMGLNYDKALSILKSAADKGSLDAKRKLGIIYLTGSIANINKALGKAYLIEAANSSDIAAQKILEKIN